jgi:hypothetical protein
VSEAPSRSRRAWANVAVLGLIVTLIFNTLGVWFQLDQARQSKEVSQIGLVTQLNSIVKDSETEINETEAPGLRCEGNQIDQLHDDEQAKVLAALDQYDYLAWLFARGRLTLDDARDYMAPAMIDAYRLGKAFIPPADLTRHVPYLERFSTHAPKDVLPPDPCRNYG